MRLPEQRRATDHDRVTVIRLLEQARLEARITAGQQHDRVNHALEADTLGELDALIEDLGDDVPSLVARHRETQGQRRLVAIICAVTVLVALLGVVLMLL